MVVTCSTCSLPRSDDLNAPVIHPRANAEKLSVGTLDEFLRRSAAGSNPSSFASRLLRFTCHTLRCPEFWAGLVTRRERCLPPHDGHFGNTMIDAGGDGSLDDVLRIGTAKPQVSQLWPMKNRRGGLKSHSTSARGKTRSGAIGGAHRANGFILHEANASDDAV
jgi:hypothetical protein